jgi:integrase
MEEDIALCSKNPVTAKVSKLVGSTKSVKAPLNPRWFDIAAASIEDKRDRAWFDVTRYLGMRLDESNRLQWSDINWQAGKVRYPGTKTPEAQAWLPVAPVVLKTLRDLYDSDLRDLNSPYVFPGRSPTTRSKKVYSRRCIFEQIQKATAIRKYLRQHPGLTQKQATAACKKDGFSGGIKLTAKDLRDYFCTEVAAKSDDAAVAMRLMRHTSLTTTTKYMRTVEDRMRKAVQDLGCDSGCDSMTENGPKNIDLAKLVDPALLSKIIENIGVLKANSSTKLTEANLIHADDIDIEPFLRKITHPPRDLERH